MKVMNPRLNELLDQLPDTDYQRLLPHLRLVSLNEGKELYTPGEHIQKITFPVTASVAIATVTGSGQSIDTATIGADGLVGLRGIAEGDSVYRFHVAASGLAYQLERGQLLRELQHGQGVYRMCLQAGIQMMRKMSMEVACANSHSLEQRVAKWILIRHDHHRSAPIRATHQSIADSLGVRREAITLTLPKMRGLSFSRGAIEVEDRQMLEHTTCECYMAQRQVHPFQLPLPMFDSP